MDKLTQLSKKYSDNTLLRGIINLIPYIGSSSDLLLSEKWNTFYHRRIDDMLEQLSNDLDGLKDKVDEEYINSEEFFDVMTNVLTTITKTRLDEKRKIYSKIIRDSITFKANVMETESILGIIEQLNEKDIVFIQFISNFRNQHSSGEFSAEFIIQNKSLGIIDTNEIVRLLFRHSYLGLLDYKMNILTLREKVKFKTTPFFEKIIGYLEE